MAQTLGAQMRTLHTQLHHPCIYQLYGFSIVTTGVIEPVNFLMSTTVSFAVYGKCQRRDSFTNYVHEMPTLLQGWRSWVRRVRICAPNVWAMSKENLDFAHPIFEPYLMSCAVCAPIIKLHPPPLSSCKESKNTHHTLFFTSTGDRC